MPQEGRLRIHGQGEIEVERVTRYLSDLKYAYDSIVVFEAVIDGMERAVRDFPYPFSRYLTGFFPGWPLTTRRAVQPVRDWPPSTQEIASLVPVSEELVMSAVKLASPGFWEFVGKLNPLEVLRQYLNDRHERRKDRDYRESAEKRRMRLENLSLENKVISERIKMAKEWGATDRDLAPLINALVYRPLTTLDSHQDHNVIENAELVHQKISHEE
jgi:hypothetical protein